MQSQFSAVKCGSWPQFLLDVDYLVVAGGGGAGGAVPDNTTGGGGGAGGYRASGFGPSPLQGSALELGLGSYAVTGGGTHGKAGS